MIIEGKNLSVGYKNTLITDFNFKINNKSSIAILGANGSGKTTLLKVLAKTLEPLSGSIFYPTAFNQSLHHISKLRAFVPSKSPETGLMNVLEFVGSSNHNYSETQIKGQLASVNIEKYSDRKFHTLSDGEKQKALIVRALIQDTPLIMMDEPVSHLDPSNKHEIGNIIKQLTATKTILFTTHDVEFACEFATEIWIIKGNRIIAGTPEQLLIGNQFESIYAGISYSFSMDKGLEKITDKAIPFIYSGLSKGEEYLISTLKNRFITNTSIAISKRSNTSYWIDISGNTTEFNNILEVLEKLKHLSIE